MYHRIDGATMPPNKIMPLSRCFGENNENIHGHAHQIYILVIRVRDQVIVFTFYLFFFNSHAVMFVTLRGFFYLRW